MPLRLTQVCQSHWPVPKGVAPQQTPKLRTRAAGVAPVSRWVVTIAPPVSESPPESTFLDQKKCPNFWSLGSLRNEDTNPKHAGHWQVANGYGSKPWHPFSSQPNEFIVCPICVFSLLGSPRFCWNIYHHASAESRTKGPRWAALSSGPHPWRTKTSPGASSAW